MKPGIFTSRQLFYIPRPDRLQKKIRSQLQFKPDSKGLREILAEFGLVLTGADPAPAGPGRSHNLIVETSTGKKVLKRYKEAVALEAVLHEHSILNYLAQSNFPAPRLVLNEKGRTFLEREGRFYALFDYLEGYFHFHSYLLTPAQTRQFIAASAQALGALHTVLRDFTPEGCNPNGFTSRQGNRWRELPWFMDKLQHCRREVNNGQTVEAQKLKRPLSLDADWIEKRLHDLDEFLKASAPPRLVIHGDFGPYNVFFKPGAPVTILDYELSRLDWRLTDLSNALYFYALGRTGFNFKKMACFIEAYRDVCPLETQELELLPSVWQFLLIRRTIVCWHSYLGSGSNVWLEEAERKIRLAHWIDGQRTQLGVLSELH